MPLWGNTDTTGNSAIFAPAQVKVAPTAANRNALYGNTTANAWFGSGETIGMYGVSEAEMRAARAGHDPRPAGPGWVLRTVGAGGRAGRVQNELLVAMGSISGDATDDSAFPDYGFTYTTQPASTSADGANDDVATFTAVVSQAPAGNAVVTYVWQKWGGAAFANLAESGAYSNTTNTVLVVEANGVVNGEIYRLGTYSANGGGTEYSANATFHVLPDIEFLVQPDDASGNADADDIVTFTVEANAAGETISYQWQFANTEDGFEDLTEAGAYSNVDTVELSVLANTASNGEIYRCEVSVDGTLLVYYSSNATLTVTTA